MTPPEFTRQTLSESESGREREGGREWEESRAILFMPLEMADDDDDATSENGEREIERGEGGRGGAGRPDWGRDGRWGRGNKKEKGSPERGSGAERRKKVC